MPHIVLEYSKNLAEKVDISDLLAEMHGSLVAVGIDKSRLKTRGIAVDHNVIGDEIADKGFMAHIELRLLRGRDDETKKKYGAAIHQAALNKIQEKVPKCALTLEVRDMDRETYIL